MVLVVEVHAYAEMTTHENEIFVSSKRVLFSSSLQTIRIAFSQERRKWSCEFFIVINLVCHFSCIWEASSSRIFIVDEELFPHIATAIQDAEYFQKVCLTLQHDKEEWVAIFRDRHTSSISICNLILNLKKYNLQYNVRLGFCRFISEAHSALPANVSICTLV